MTEQGTVFTEIACIFALVAITAIASMTLLGNQLKSTFENAGNTDASLFPGTSPLGGTGVIAPAGGGISKGRRPR